MVSQSSNSFLMLEQSMRFLWNKQSAILNNVSNAETPGYKAKYVTFEETFRDRLESASSSSRPSGAYREAIEGARSTLHVADNETTRMDGNGVNITDQFIEMSRNAFQLQYAMTSISSDYSTLRAAIRG